MTKHILIIGTLALLSLSLSIPAFAQTVSPTKSSSRTGVLKSVTQRLKKLRPRVVIGAGNVTAINDATLTVEKQDKSLSYTVMTGTFEHCATKFRRRYGGESSLSEIKVGHKLNVIGRWQDDAKTIVEACIIRDQSIQKFRGTFTGIVQSLTSDGFVLSSVNRGKLTVSLLSTTKIVNRKEETITQSDIADSHRVRVKGLWDRSDSTLSEVTHVKDYTLPPIPTRPPKPTRPPRPTRVPKTTVTPTPIAI